MKKEIITMLCLTLLLIILTSCTQQQLSEQTIQKRIIKRIPLAINETELQNLGEDWRINACYDSDGPDELTPAITVLSANKIDKNRKNIINAEVYSIPDQCINSNIVSEVVCSRLAGEQRENKLRFSVRPPELPIRININCPAGTTCLMKAVKNIDDEEVLAGACIREQLKPIPLPPMERIPD